MSTTPVLLIHSGGASSRQWRKLAELLAPAREVLAPDLLGYGSAGAWPVGQPFHFTQDLEHLAQLLAGRRADVVGHSYGGLLALQLALARPELVRSIAVFDPVAFGVLSPEQREASFDGVGGPYVPDAAGVDEAWLTAFVDWWNGPGTWARLPPGARAAFREVGWKVAQEVITLMADRTDRAGYAAIDVPALVLGGGLSPPTERLTVELLASALPQGRLQMFPDLGHMAPITHPDRVNPVIAEALASV